MNSDDPVKIHQPIEFDLESASHVMEEGQDVESCPADLMLYSLLWSRSLE